MWALWNSTEPLTLNRYSYCVGNPVNHVDKSGHMVPAAAGCVIGAIGGFILGTLTEAGKLITQGSNYDWKEGALNIANTTTAGAVGGTVLGATFNPALAATAAGGAYGGLSGFTGSVWNGDSASEVLVNTVQGTTIGSVGGFAGAATGMAAAGYVSTLGVSVMVQVTATGAAGGVGAGVTTRALTGQDTTPEAVATDAIYGAMSAVTFYGTSKAYEIVTTPKFPNTYIRDHLAAAEEADRTGNCESGTNTSWYNTDGSMNYPPNNGAIPGTEKTISLKPGDTLGRYGNIGDKSHFVTQAGADASKLSLPPDTNPSIYQEFVVVKEIPNIV